MSELDYAAIEVEDVYVDACTRYSFESDMFTPADAFSLSLGIGTSNSRELKKTIDKLKAVMFPGAKVKFWIGHGSKRALQGTGVIDAPDIQNDGEGGTQFSIQGRDFAVYLTGDACPKEMYEQDDTLIAVAKKVVAPFGLSVKADHTAGRDLRQARVSKDTMRKYQDRARSMGLPASMMSEKIAASIDAGTIQFGDLSAVNPFGTLGTIDADFSDSSFVSGASDDLQRQRAKVLGIPFSGGLPGLSALAIYQLRVKDVQPQTGETRWEFLDRHARRNGCLMRMDPDGTLVLCGLEYNQQPSYRLIRRIHQQGQTSPVITRKSMVSPSRISENNIISGGVRYDASSQYKTVVVYGKVKGDDVTRSPFKGEAIDTSPGALPYEKTLVIHDSSIKTVEAAKTRAQYELGKSRQGAQMLSYIVRGHGSNGLVFATDTIAHVTDENSGLDGPFYVVSRTFLRNEASGPLTQISLVPPGSIALADVA